MAKTISNFPYFSQLDNVNNPYGSCNVTSVAMCLWYFGIRGDGSQKQLEDQLYNECLKHGWSRHDPQGLKSLIEYHNCIDNLTYNGTVADIQKAIESNQPCIIHGYFTKSGHIVTVKGYDDTGLIVNDPYGEYFHTGYVKNSPSNPNRGEGLHYSYSGIIQPVCSPESNPSKNIWLHRVSKK